MDNLKYKIYILYQLFFLYKEKKYMYINIIK